MNNLDLVIDYSRLQKALLAQPDKLQKNLDTTIDRVLHLFARSARDKAPKAFSNLVNSIGIERNGPLEGTVGPSVNYGEAVEVGTGIFGPGGQPSFSLPPVEHIHDWVKLVNLTPNDPSMDTADLAWAIAKTIAVEGTQPQPYMAPALEENQRAAEKLIDVAISASLAA